MTKENIKIAKVTKFGNSGHILVTKELIGSKILLLPLSWRKQLEDLFNIKQYKVNNLFNKTERKIIEKLVKKDLQKRPTWTLDSIRKKGAESCLEEFKKGSVSEFELKHLIGSVLVGSRKKPEQKATNKDYKLLEPTIKRIKELIQ